MCETISQPTFDFNRSIRVEGRPERVTADSGAFLIREIMHKLKIDQWLGNHLTDFRREDLVTHPWRELLRIKLILLCQGRHDSLIETAGRRIRAANRGRRLATLTIDVDSLPAVVHGHQPGSLHNGHYHDRIYHPLIATTGERGDLLGGKLRHGNVHTADGAESFIMCLLDQAERKICIKAHLRPDAFPAFLIHSSAC